MLKTTWKTEYKGHVIELENRPNLERLIVDGKEIARAARRHLGTAQLSGDHSRREPVYEGGRQHSFFKKSAGTPIHRIGGWQGDL